MNRRLVAIMMILPESIDRQTAGCNVVYNLLSTKRYACSWSTLLLAGSAVIPELGLQPAAAFLAIHIVSHF